jgi:hypothetical protein
MDVEKILCKLADLRYNLQRRRSTTLRLRSSEESIEHALDSHCMVVSGRWARQ